MKTLFFLSIITLSLQAADIADVSDLSHIKVQTDDIGIVIAGDVKSVLANYPTLASKLKQMLAQKLAAEDEFSAQARITKLQVLGVTLPKAVTDAHAARLEALRVKKEAALLIVKDKDPTRALTKMNELISAGVLITKTTQDAVKAVQPTPAVVPVVPIPTDDGL